MSSRLPAMLLICAAALSACDKRPASADEVAEKLRLELSGEGQEINWIRATPATEEGSFDVIADRVAINDPDNSETLICKASATTSTSSWTCQTARPSIMVQAAEKLKADYKDRDIEVEDYTLARTGKDNDFAGYFILAAPNDGPVARIPCRGSQDGLDFKLDCDFSFAGDDAAEETPAAPIPAT